jgi:polyphosphate kinase 2 (PPK2 family)
VLWPHYIQAYENAISATSTSYAPWYVVPADFKINRNLLISRLLFSMLKKLQLEYPPVPADFETIMIND